MSPGELAALEDMAGRVRYRASAAVYYSVLEGLGRGWSRGSYSLHNVWLRVAHQWTRRVV